MDKIIGLRVDVDTVKGFKSGVIPILNILKKHKIRSTFCIVSGYDNPIRASRRLITEKGFLKRILSLRKSLVYSHCILNNPSIKDVVNHIMDTGQELCLHGYHHFDWQNNLRKWSKERIVQELQNGIQKFKLLTGIETFSFAAPGWVTKNELFVAEECFNFSYCSDTRGRTPFYPLVDKREIKTLQIPVTLPTLDELISLMKPENLPDIPVKTGDVYCAHAEFDGIGYSHLFENFIEKQINRGFSFVSLSEIKKTISNPFISRISWKKVPGRTNIITCQE